MNDLHRKLGVPLKEGIGHTEAESQGLLNKKPWVITETGGQGSAGVEVIIAIGIDGDRPIFLAYLVA